MAVNGAGLRTVSHSEQIYIDLTPPEFEYVYDGDSSDFDIQFQTSLNISMAWSVKDPESGIQECSWAIGLSPMDTSLQDYTQIAITENVASTVISSTPYDRIFSTMRCTNAAGRTASISTDGLKISLVGVDTSFSETVVGSTSDVNFASFTGLNLEDGQYKVTV
ncbi:hypothetical protein MAR_021092 [Mya arenaria]|uniref:Uncharacterized protein n=1 Tax=Mya arenaria TaxID=6604 RepID=A0ABY7EAF4_MYAAR|nr:hypothetical protein MAR_021092 [Mya arenaria]